MKGRKRHIAVDTSGLLLGVLVHVTDIQDADSAGDLLKRIKPLYCWLEAVFADIIYNRIAVLIACVLLGLTLIIVRRIAGRLASSSVHAGGWSSEHSDGLGDGDGCRKTTRNCRRSRRRWPRSR